MGASYAGWAHCEQRKNFGELVLVVTCDSERAGFALETVLQEIRRLAENPISDVELATAKSRLLAQYAAETATAPELAQRLAEQFASGIPPDWYRTLSNRLRAITAERVRSVASRDLDETHLGISVGGDPELVWPQLARIGTVRWSYFQQQQVN
ncbi:MAG TPA: hypothetical protein VF103_07565, partial [Polyangiaceae bacterium]